MVGSVEAVCLNKPFAESVFQFGRYLIVRVLWVKPVNEKPFKILGLPFLAVCMKLYVRRVQNFYGLLVFLACFRKHFYGGVIFGLILNSKMPSASIRFLIYCGDTCVPITMAGGLLAFTGVLSPSSHLAIMSLGSPKTV